MFDLFILEKNKLIRFRPHHFVCTLGFEGKGYTPLFVENYQKIVDTLNNDPNTLIEVTEQLDDVCAPCIHQRSNNLCAKQTLIQQLDDAYCALLGLKDGEVISWENAKHLIKEKVSLENFHVSCEGCQWKALGVCENALKELLKA